MLKFLSKVKVDFNALDARAGVCVEFLAQCSTRKARESNPSCVVEVNRRTDNDPPQIKVTFVDGVDEVFDATTASTQSIRSLIIDKGKYLEIERMFRDAGEAWPVVIPKKELKHLPPAIKPGKPWLKSSDR